MFCIVSCCHRFEMTRRGFRLNWVNWRFSFCQSFWWLLHDFEVFEQLSVSSCSIKSRRLIGTESEHFKQNATYFMLVVELRKAARDCLLFISSFIAFSVCVTLYVDSPANGMEYTGNCGAFSINGSFFPFCQFGKLAMYELMAAIGFGSSTSLRSICWAGCPLRPVNVSLFVVFKSILWGLMILVSFSRLNACLGSLNADWLCLLLKFYL